MHTASSNINLDAPLAWTKANQEELKMLQSLQGNILKSHGRHFTANIFFTFGNDKALKSRRLLRELANYHLTNAHQQLLDVQHFKATGTGGGAFCHLALSAKGYQAIGLGDKMPDDQYFLSGMKAKTSIEALNDPTVECWEPRLQTDMHAILLAAHESEAETTILTETLTKLLTEAGCMITYIQRGNAIFKTVNGTPEGIEHFGYVDGRSQPLMLIEDIEAEANLAGMTRWNPAFPLQTALVKDPGINDSYSYGSYFIFRKLEQRVRDFKTEEQTIADTLGLKNRELAGAMLVGRFEDGTPVTLSDDSRDQKPPNDFNYVGDSGSRCPFHAHIRKVNPRGSSGDLEANERTHIMARRGIPYADKQRLKEPGELPDVDNIDEFYRTVQPYLPEDGVGLLFMAYNSNLAEQFTFTQQMWANNTNIPTHPAGPHGIDTVIGQAVNTPGEQKIPTEWDNPEQGSNANCPFAGFVNMRGGEYFFSPSLTFLQSI